MPETSPSESLPPARRPLFLRGVTCGLISSLLLVIATPPYSLWWLAFLTPVPLLHAAEFWVHQRRTASTPPLWILGLGILAGILPWWLWSHWWISGMTAAGYVPLAIALSMCSAATTMLIAWSRRHLPKLPLPLVAPFLWVAIEGLRGDILFHGYCWSLLGHPLIDGPTLLSRPASIVGAYSISFLVAAVMATIVDLVIHRTKPLTQHAASLISGVGLAASLLVAGLLWGPTATNAPKPADTLTVGLIQTNVPQSNKIAWSIEQEMHDFDRFRVLTIAAAKSTPRPDLLVWPETMVPGPGLDPDLLTSLAKKDVFFELSVVRESGPSKIWATSFADALLDLQKELNIPMLVGAEGMDKGRVNDANGSIRIESDARYNSSFYLREGRVDPSRYDKLRLTPFGEEMPYIQSWPWLQDRVMALGAGGMKFDLSQGKAPKVHEVRIASLNRTVAIATPICYEVADATVCQRLVYSRGKRQAELLVSLTNDGWFGNSDMGRLQHLTSARWRCVELGTPMARAANTGITALIDAEGRLQAAGVLVVANPADPKSSSPNSPPALTRTDGYLTGSVALAQSPTLYGRIGRLELPGPLGRPVNCDSFAAFCMTIGLALTATTAGVARFRPSCR